MRDKKASLRHNKIKKIPLPFGRQTKRRTHYGEHYRKEYQTTSHGLSYDTGYSAERLFVSRQTVSNYETGKSNPDIDTLTKLAEIFETDVNTLIYGPPAPANKTEKIRRLCVLLGIAWR